MNFVHSLRQTTNCLQSIVSSSQRATSSMLNMVKNNNKHIVWIDMEMTGLDLETCHILEIACLITNKDLKIISKDLNIVIHQPNEILENMNDWCVQNHEKTGLITESRLSKTTVQDAEQIVLKYLQSYIEEGTSPLAGSSVYMDRIFLSKYMPSVNNYLNYKIIDTTTLRELILMWNLNVPELKKMHCHRALSDIKESIKQLEHYKKYLFNL
ncbi:oligoribonuclease-like [Colletes gigas]|uniref:oligoribonuclease-like n=1 Tax=Colletes gigas TaxID=935657 RepID=UPI001C9ACDF1|nr:oligoribonuclease-like [Colletes gigas]